MKNTRISLLSLALVLAGAMSAAWGAESVMSLISDGEAVQKQVMDTKDALTSAEKRDKELAVEAKQIQAGEDQVGKDSTQWQKDAEGLNARISDYKTRCGDPNKHLTPDEFKACTADKDQLTSDQARLEAQRADINKRISDLKPRADSYNSESKGSGDRVRSAYAGYNSSIKKEGAWLDAARNLMISDAFKSIGAKAKCPDVTKNPKTDEDQIKMTDDVLGCLKRVSASN